MDKKIKHLEIIQGVISRMASNSFLLKGWCLTVISGLCVMAINNKCFDILFVLIILFVNVVFWVLDGYFLWQERLFRILYDKVRETAEGNIDFSMNTNVIFPREAQKKKFCWKNAIFSKTLLLYYGSILSIFLFFLCYVIFSIGLQQHIFLYYYIS